MKPERSPLRSQSFIADRRLGTPISRLASSLGCAGCAGLIGWNRPELQSLLENSLLVRMALYGCPILAPFARVGIFGSTPHSSLSCNLTPHPYKRRKDGGPALLPHCWHGVVT